MKKWYGSLNNRIDEGNQFVKEIKVGDGVTEYLWSDRHAYEVVAVESQEHIFIRRYDVKRIDKNGMSEVQDYEFISNEKNPIIEIVKRNNGWNKVSRVNKQMLLERARNYVENHNGVANSTLSMETRIEVEFKYIKCMCGVKWTEARERNFNEGKDIVSYTKWNNISIGVLDEYYDYSF